MKNQLNIMALQELTSEEAAYINVGESAWYWVSYTIGATLGFVKGAIENPPNLPSATVYK